MVGLDDPFQFLSPTGKDPVSACPESSPCTVRWERMERASWDRLDFALWQLGCSDCEMFHPWKELLVPQRVRAPEETHGVGFWNEQSGSLQIIFSRGAVWHLLVAAPLGMFANLPLVAMVYGWTIKLASPEVSHLCQLGFSRPLLVVHGPSQHWHHLDSLFGVVALRWLSEKMLTRHVEIAVSPRKHRFRESHGMICTGFQHASIVLAGGIRQACRQVEQKSTCGLKVSCWSLLLRAMQTFCEHLEMVSVPGPNTESQVHRLGTYCRCFVLTLLVTWPVEPIPGPSACDFHDFPTSQDHASDDRFTIVHILLHLGMDIFYFDMDALEAERDAMRCPTADSEWTG